MNYYPQYGQNPYYQQTVYQQPNYYQQPQIQQPQFSLYGKVVDGIDVVRATDVPITQSGIFPKADMSELYIKNWCPDGTTKITTYIPVVEPTSEKTEEDKYEVALSEIKSAISALSKKVEGIKPSSPTPMTKRRKEVDDDE